MMTIILTAYLATLGQTGYGIAAIIAQLAVLGGVFVYGSNRREKERRDRIAAMKKQEKTEEEVEKQASQE